MYPNPFLSRNHKKFYITFNELVIWAHSISEKTAVGELYHDAYTRVQLMFNKANKIFNGTETYYDPQKLHKADWNIGETHPPLINYPTVFPSSDITFIFNYYLDYYSERLLEQPVEPGKFNLTLAKQMDYNDAMYFILDKVCRMIDNFIALNSDKYYRRLALLNLKYNPIDNYDGNEYEHTDYSGKEVFEREAQLPKGVSAIKLTAPATGVKLTETTQSGETYIKLEAEPEDDYKKNSAVAQVGDTRSGKIAGSASVVEESGTTTASTITEGASKPKTSHYTTTYDNAATNRLESYDENEGDVATSQQGVSSEDVPAMLEVYRGAPGTVSYKDTTDYDDRDDDKDIQKWGNMGVTATQDMMMKEKEVLDNCWAVLQDFMEELNSYIFLGVYAL